MKTELGEQCQQAIRILETPCSIKKQHTMIYFEKPPEGYIWYTDIESGQPTLISVETWRVMQRVEEWKAIFPSMNDCDFDFKNGWFEEIKPKEWEIVSFIGGFLGKDNVILNRGAGNLFWGFVDILYPFPEERLLKETKIHSVKRLSDGETFSVGDGLQQGLGVLKGFEIINDTMFANYERDNHPYNTVIYGQMPLSEIKKLKPQASKERIDTHVDVGISQGGKYGMTNMSFKCVAGFCSQEKIPSIQAAIENVLNEGPKRGKDVWLTLDEIGMYSKEEVEERERLAFDTAVIETIKWMKAARIVSKPTYNDYKNRKQ